MSAPEATILHDVHVLVLDVCTWRATGPYTVREVSDALQKDRVCTPSSPLTGGVESHNKAV